MTYKQVRDLLKLIEDFHRQLSSTYQRLSTKADCDRMQLLLDYMSRHETNIKTTLAAQDSEQTVVLDVWMQFTPEDELQKVLENTNIRDGMSAEEIVESALHFDRALVDMYRQLAESADTPRVQEFFESLVTLEEQHAGRYSRLIVEMKDA